MLFRRLFLLDQDQVRIAGAANYDSKGLYLESIEHEGRVVGWIGFTPMGNALPPDAKRFLSGQVRILVVSFALALVVAAALAYLLAGNVSRPVRQLVEKVSQLSRGEYQARAAVETRDEIGSLASHVNELAQTLEKNRTARQRWMADIAHELRTPVSILKGEIEAMIDGVRQADEQTTTSLHEEVNHLSKLVDDLQALALSDAGALNIRKEKVDLSALTAQAADAFATRLAQRQISLQAYPDKGVTLIGDPHRLRQLLHNLLQNCYGYVESGGRVRVLLMRSAGSAELVLEDSGPGVAEDQLEHLFDRFYRGDSSRSRSLGGSGLGLSICKNIVEAHGGAILARQSDLGGLKIRILLPG
jgi:two-component system sensor histidine kinase BaeS